jgi:hypothetical protein
MPTYQELRSTYAQLTIPELRDLTLRPLELTAQAQAALADELSLRDVPTEYEVPPSLTRTWTRPVSWQKWWLTIFQAWVTFQIILFAAAFIVFHRIFDGWTLLMLAVAAVPCFGLVLIANKHPSARRFWLGLLAVMLVARLTSAPVLGLLNWGRLFGIAINVAWYRYWLQSKHVATESSPVHQPASPTDP